MEYILIIAMLAIFAIGYIIMDHLDKFISSPNYLPDIKGVDGTVNKSENALVLGESELLFEIVKLLKQHSITCTIIKDTNELNKSDSYKYLLAVDKNDLENLMMCLIGEKMMGIKCRIAICNCIDNLKIYADNHIPFLYGDNISAINLITTLLSSSSTTGGKSNV